MADVFFRDFGGYPAVLSFTPIFKPGDPAPIPYCDWHAWADVQHKAGLLQVRCADCGLWKYPQELSALVRETTVFRTKRDANGIRIKTPVCVGCAAETK